MLILTVEERTYEAGTPWSYMCAHSGLIASIDLEFDASVKTEKGDDGTDVILEDVTALFYSVMSDGVCNDYEDYHFMEELESFAYSDPKELRYWFKGLEPGMYELVLRWMVDPQTPHKQGGDVDDRYIEFVRAVPLEESTG